MTGHAALAQMVKHEGHGSVVLATGMDSERVACRPSTQRLRTQNLSPPFSLLLEPRDASYFIST